MVQPVILDVLLLLILLLLVPLGFYRGGLREVCSAAGLLLGLLIANEWAARWGGWIAGLTKYREDVCQFVTAVAVLTLVTAVVGYGAGAAFSYRPGPGGRMYGGLISLLIGAVFLGSVMNLVARFLTDGAHPAVIEDGYLARALTIGLDWVLLIVGMAVVLATLFGMIVRERNTDEYEIPVQYQSPVEVQPTRSQRSPVAPAVTSDKIEPVVKSEIPAARATSAVTVKEIRHWEEPAPPKTSDLASGWQRTWPRSTKGDSLRTRSETGSTRRGEPPAQSSDQQTTGSHDARIIREWLAADQDEQSRDTSIRRSDVDE